MIIEAISAALTRLYNELSSANSKKETAEDEQRDMEELIEMLRAKKREMEDGLDTTVSNLESRLSRLSEGTRFAQDLREQVRKIVMNDSALQAIQETQAGERRSRDRALELEDLIESLRKTIASLRQQIRQLTMQMNKEEER